MIDRFLRWMIAGLLTAGLAAGVLSGAGPALADEDTTDGGEPSSQSSDAGTESSKDNDSPADKPARVEPTPADDDESRSPSDDDDAPTDGADVVEESETDEDESAVSEDEPAVDDKDSARTRDTTQPETTDAVEEHVVVEPDDVNPAPAEEPAEVVVDTTDPTPLESETPLEQAPAPSPPSTPNVVETISAAVTSMVTSLNPFAADDDSPLDPAAQTPLWTLAAAARREFETGFQSPTLADPADALTTSEVLPAAAAAPAAQPTLINVIGTLAWGVFDAFTKLVLGPPVVPPGSSVTVGQSTLQIDCGDGYLADADWYYPKTGQPEKFIYFQHGFPARAGVYNLTLTELAERNNAIVVAPSITSNYFACDGCSLTADAMHAAVARLFEGDRAALLASARAAGFEGALPTDFVLSGQSAGGMLAAGASGYFYASAPAAKKADMVGVLLFDTSAANGALARALDKLPSSVPVLHIAGTPTVINNGGDASQVLLAKRPGQFNGVQLVGGSHSDAFQSSAYFGLVQALVGLTFGPSRPENVEAVQVLSQGWIADMYAGRVYAPATRKGIYGNPAQPGQAVIDIPTDAGLARGYVLPGPPPALSPIEMFVAGLLQSINSNDFATCAADVDTAVSETVVYSSAAAGRIARGSACSS
ncbi:hypothetical protein [Mycobacterium deserti]|uniref:Uncharacterized protein n=1 Tax=Mycobacterium deserti TaxID=2978347 RepID=A0ABT2M7L8_9MYCO|nr:hypothetical protein [Mycobacterium deserti]MCT7658247.1 hypothetical protein [Mycobacterium deserti]